MAISDLLNRRVRARPDEDDHEDEEMYSEGSVSGEDRDGEISDESQTGDEQAGDDDDASDGSLDGTDESHDEESDDDNIADNNNGNEDIRASLNNISFGALAKAQASIGPKGKKRTTASATESTESPLDDIRTKIREAREQKRQEATNRASKDDEENESDKRKNIKKKSSNARSSKHAPTVQSSKYAVTRRRTVIEPPAVPKSRDPRFDPTVLSHSKGRNPDAANKAYAFLDEYRASEFKDLKEQLAKTKDATQKERLKREIRSRADQLRTRQNKKREDTILAEHKKSERQLIREGKKSNPYYLKKSDLKKQMLVKKYEEMNSKDRAKALERRRKKITSKERKEMPWERRGMEGEAGPDRKRKRLE